VVQLGAARKMRRTDGARIGDKGRIVVDAI
jgi:hypothetical protein